MRLHDLLTESVKKYEPLFNMFRRDGQMPDWVATRINSVEKLLGRHDRVVWALRWERYLAAARLRAAPEVLKKLARDLGPADQIEHAAENYQRLMRDDFPHWKSLPIKQFDAIIFDRQSPSEIKAAYKAAEDEWKATRKQVLNHAEHYPEVDDGGEGEDFYFSRHTDDWEKEKRKADLERRGKISLMIDLGNGWGWWDLNRTYCTAEAGAMGHCGNEPSAQPGDRVLSLRQEVAPGEFRPSLTFILHDDGMLGEMKGRSNEKPAERYHEAIIALLKNPEIEGITGGGYEAQKNFSIFDLTPEQRDPLLAKKPDLMTIFDRLDQYKAEPTEEKRAILDQKIKRKLQKFRYERLDYDEGDVVIREWESREKYSQMHWGVDRIIETFDKVEDILLDFVDINRKTAEEWARETRNRHFDAVFDATYYYYNDGEYAVEGVYESVMPDGSVRLKISINSFINFSPSGDWIMQHEDDEDTTPFIERIDSLDEKTGDDREYDWRDIEDNVDLEEPAFTLARYAFEQEGKILRRLADEIENDMASTRQGHYHSRDHRQMSLDLGEND